jgi:proteic killer suppression protein
VRYDATVIRTFADADTELLWDTGKSRRIPASLRSSALKKLFILRRAVQLQDLTAPPGNRLEALSGDRKGQHSIRINDQYRICFRWINGDAYDVEIVDYH